MKHKIQAFLIVIIGVFALSTAAVLWRQNTLASVGAQYIVPPQTDDAGNTVEAIHELPLLDTSNPYNLFALNIQSEKQANSSTIALQFFGDIMLDRNVAKNMSTSGLNYVFANVSTTKTRMFGAADMLIANLEGPFAPTRVKTSKSIAFRFDPKLAEQLKAYGFHGFSLANNHAYDMGRANASSTRGILKQHNLGFFGDELKEGAEYTWVQNDVAFLGVHNTCHEPDLKKLSAVLVDAKKKARYVIVNVHWGDEYKRISNEKQRKLAHWLIDNGAGAVIGHHPHVVQEMEIYKGAPIFYSLGNFIFDQYFSKDTQEGLSVGLTLADGKAKSIYLFPFYGVKSQVQLMTGERRDEFLKWMEENSRLDSHQITDGKIIMDKWNTDLTD